MADHLDMFINGASQLVRDNAVAAPHDEVTDVASQVAMLHALTSIQKPQLLSGNDDAQCQIAVDQAKLATVPGVNRPVGARKR